MTTPRSIPFKLSDHQEYYFAICKQQRGVHSFMLIGAIDKNTHENKVLNMAGSFFDSGAGKVAAMCESILGIGEGRWVFCIYSLISFANSTLACSNTLGSHDDYGSLRNDHITYQAFQIDTEQYNTYLQLMGSALRRGIRDIKFQAKVVKDDDIEFKKKVK